ncbi:NAD-dependent epimerase/dehydratase family protein, partial [Candidatus Parcubacteria bacterium]
MKIAITGCDRGRIRDWMIEEWGCIPVVCDITQPDDVARELKRVDPDILIHAAAMTDVDECERQPTRAVETNLRGTWNVLRAFRGDLFVFISSDHVFDGKRGPYAETAKQNPVNCYGLTKFAAEMLVNTHDDCKTMIVRTSKLFTIDDITRFLAMLKTVNGRYAVPTMLRRSFMYLPHFALSLADIIARVAEGEVYVPSIVHISGSETVSYYKFWSDVLDRLAPGERRLIKPRRIYFHGNAERPKKGG